jgi:hypothetical protein
VGDAIRGYAGCVAREHGPVLCWSGPNVLLQTSRYFGAMTGPRAQPGTEGIVRVVRAQEVLCGLHQDGRVLCWRPGYTAPVEAPVHDAVELTAGHAHACAARREGGLVCFGLATLPAYSPPGSAPPVLAPLPAPALRDVHGLVLRGTLGCGVHADGTVACWDVQTGRETGVPPILQPRLDGAAMLADAGSFACVLDRRGAATCRFGGTAPQPETRFAELGASLSHVAARGDTACVVTTDGRVACWGPGPRRGTITGEEEARRRTAHQRPPWLVPGVGDSVRVAITESHVCVLTRSRHVRCFGPNEAGELGDGTTVEAATPTFVVRHDVLPDPPHRPYGCRATLAQRTSCPRLGDDCVLQPVPGGWDLGPAGGAYCDEACMARREMALSTMPTPACECSCDPAVVRRSYGQPVPPPPDIPSGRPSARRPAAP